MRPRSSLRRPRHVLPLVVTAGLVLGLAACGGDDDSDATTSTEAPAATPSSAAPAVTDPAPAPTDPPATDPPAPTTEAPVVTEPPRAELELARAGEYGVGRTTITIDDPARDRSFPVDIWYPIDADSTGPAARYEFTPDIFLESEVAIADAAVSAQAPFPLVVYSHGSGGLRYVASFFTEFLASHGYVVAAPDHVGNTAVDVLLGAPAPFEQNAIDRPTDVSQVIDALTGVRDDVALASAVDAERIGIAGHSFGGFTTFALESGFESSAGSSAADDRIDAIVAMAPAPGRLTDEQLGAIDVPLMLITGTADDSTPIDPDTVRPWELAGSPFVYRLDLADAGHQSFTDVCDYQVGLPLLPGVPEVLIDAVDGYAAQACLPELMPIDRAQALTTTYALAFLDATVAGDADALSAIDPAGVVAPDDVTLQIR